MGSTYCVFANHTIFFILLFQKCLFTYVNMLTEQKSKQDLESEHTDILKMEICLHVQGNQEK